MTKNFLPSRKFFDTCCLSCLLPINLLTTPVTSSALHFNYTTYLLHLSFHRSLNWIQKLIGPPCSKVGKYVLISIGSFNNCTKSEIDNLLDSLHQNHLEFWTHIGQIPQDGENEQNVAFFFFWSSTLTKRFDFFKFSRDFVRCILEILFFS